MTTVSGYLRTYVCAYKPRIESHALASQLRHNSGRDMLIRERGLRASECLAEKFATITGYGSTLYIGIAMVFVFSPYVWKLSRSLLLISTFHNFTAQRMSKLSCMPNISLKFLFWPKL